MDLRDGWTVGPSSTGAGGSRGLLLLECSLLRYLEAELSESSSTVGRGSPIYQTVLLCADYKQFAGR